MMAKAMAALIGLVGATALVGCRDADRLLMPAGMPWLLRSADRSGLRVSVGWSGAAGPGHAAEEAVRAALGPLGSVWPDLLLVWDNWQQRQAAAEVLRVAGHHAPSSVIFGGKVDWPVSSVWTPTPTVLAVAFSGGWQMAAASATHRPGRERQIGRSLADSLALDRQEAGKGASAPAGQLVLLFGQVGGPDADNLVEGLSEGLGRDLPVIGGGGAAGEDRQYVAGQIDHGRVWAVRLAGPFTVRSVYLQAEPQARSIRETVSLAASMLAEQSRASAGQAPDGRGDRPGSSRPSSAFKPEQPLASVSWRLALMTHSAGWLAYIDRPDQLIRHVADRLTDEPIRAAAAGWAGQTQIGRPADDHAAKAGQFDLSMTVIEPLGTDGPAPGTGLR